MFDGPMFDGAIGFVSGWLLFRAGCCFALLLGGVMRPWFWLCLMAGVVGSQVCLWSTTLPLGIPGEWTWTRIASEPDAVWNLVGVAAAAALYVAFVEAGTRRLGGTANSKRRSRELFGWLTGLVAVSFTWLWVVQESAPIRSRLGKSPFVLYYPGSSGYFTKSRYKSPDAAKAPDAATLLSEYEALMRERDVLHIGTHPPGLFLIFHGLIGLCQHSPALSAFLDATQPASFREACDVISRNSVRSVPPRPLLPADRRVLWLATLLVMATAAVAVVPLFWLVWRTHDAAAAWQTASLWPAIPAVAVFTPKSDVAFALVGLLMVWAWLAAVDRRSLLLALLAGLMTWCGLMMSLAFLPVVLFMAIVGWRPVAPTVPSTETTGSDTGLNAWMKGAPPGRCLVAGAVGFLIPTLLMSLCCRINLWAVWWLNYQNHAAFYVQFPRTYWKWLLVNPLELAFAAGWPVMLLSVGFLGSAARSRRHVAMRVAIGVVVVWGSLWLTGKNSGEAARLWIVFMPWLVWLAGLRLAEINPSGTRGRYRPSLIVLAVQLVVCALTVARVSGFDL